VNRLRDLTLLLPLFFAAFTSGNTLGADPSRNGEVGPASSSARRPADRTPSVWRISFDIEPSVVVPFSKQFDVGFEAPAKLRLEWKETAAISLGAGIGYHRVVDHRDTVMVSGTVYPVPVLLGLEYMGSLSERYAIRLRIQVEGGWFFFHNEIDSATLDTLAFSGFPDHDERITGGPGVRGGVWLEWSGRPGYFVRMGLVFRGLQPRVEIDDPVLDAASGTVQPDSTFALLDGIGFGVGGGFFF
jgi:hypothetical protein